MVFGGFFKWYRTEVSGCFHGVTPLELAGIVLAAGKGTRMRSDRPKVLHALAGRPMLDWVTAALESAGVKALCVVLSEDLTGFGPFLEQRPGLSVALQINRLGTGDAVASAAYAFAGAKTAPFAKGKLARGGQLSPSKDAMILISAGDTPALDPAGLKRFVEAAAAEKAAVSVLGMRPASPFGYGRMLIKENGGMRHLERIVEEKDCTENERQVGVVNTGLIAARADVLFDLIAELKDDNAQREYYLTDCVALARKRGLLVTAHVAEDAASFAGINDRRQLAAVETTLVRRKVEQLMLAGVTVRLPDSVYVDWNVSADGDAEVGAGAVLLAGTRLGRGAKIGAGAVLEGVEVGEGAEVGAGSVLTRTKVKAGETLPPLTRL